MRDNGWGLKGGISARSPTRTKACMQEHIPTEESNAAQRARLADGLKSRAFILVAAVLLIGTVAVWLTGGFASSSGAVAQSSQRQGGGQGRTGVPVETAQATKKN